MRIIPISEIKEMDGDEPVRCTKGTLVKIYKAKKGTNERGEWSFQRGEIKDASETIPIFLKGHSFEIPASWRGKQVVFEAHKGDKGYSGVYAYDDEYDGKVTRVLKLTPTAQIYLDDGEPTQRDEENGNGHHRAATTSRQPSAPGGALAAPAQPKGWRENVLEAKRFLAREANLYVLALEAVHAVILPAYHELYPSNAVSDELFGNMVASILIPARNQGLDIAMPVARIADLLKEKSEKSDTPPPPPPPPEPVDDDIPF